MQGSILEVGVWRGGIGAILAKAAEANGKRVFLADAFEGAVKAGSKDTLYIGGVTLIHLKRL
ncbi:MULTISPECIES: TylF/MycF/NovP-related O-methyltransferase [unclassified Cyanobium]|uniref:TylF/MycF/NovP-related O-methyltransferase n=1 Tax=unclassified Cyanobium TaxID=2627006 RepID=UPI0037BEA98D